MAQLFRGLPAVADSGLVCTVQAARQRWCCYRVPLCLLRNGLFPYESALRGTSSNVQWGKELVVVDVARPITLLNEGARQLPRPMRASGTASAATFAAPQPRHCRRSGEQAAAPCRQPR